MRSSFHTLRPQPRISAEPKTMASSLCNKSQMTCKGAQDILRDSPEVCEDGAGVPLSPTGKFSSRELSLTPPRHKVGTPDLGPRGPDSRPYPPSPQHWMGSSAPWNSLDLTPAGIWKALHCITVPTIPLGFWAPRRQSRGRSCLRRPGRYSSF